MSEQNKAKLAVFEGKQIRKVLHEGAWWFAIVDGVAALTDSINPSGYLKDMRRRDPSLAELFKGGGQIATPLALPFVTAGGTQKILCWNIEETQTGTPVISPENFKVLEGGRTKRLKGPDRKS